MARRTEDDEVPRLPRGRGLRFSFGELVRILMVATALIALLVLQKPCARSVSQFVTGFGSVDAGPPIDAGPATPPPGVRLRADMTPAELEAAIAAARAGASAGGADAGVLDAPASVDAGR
ncbi:MAG: hypothetical protein R3B06_22025 [Kofleriaceae bacterium]